MSSYNIFLSDSSGNFTPTLRRAPTAPTDGTVVAIPWVVNNNDAAGTTEDTASKNLNVAAWAAINRMLNDRADGN